MKNGKAETVPVLYQLQKLVETLETEGTGNCSAITLLTRDSKTGSLTINSLTEHGPDDNHDLFIEMAKALGYGKIN